MAGCLLKLPFDAMLCIFLTVPLVGLQCVNVAFPGHTHFSPDIGNLSLTWTNRSSRIIHVIILSFSIRQT